MSKRTKLNTIRIIGGQWRGRRIPVLDMQGLRPTTDRVRETVFNWLMYDLAGARCLDLFAGTGALGLESLSRGASNTKFIESNAQVAELLQKNLITLYGQTDQISGLINCTNAINFLSKPSAAAYDIVFLDPPFESDLLEQSICLLSEGAWLADGAMIYLEQDADKEIVKVPSSWQLHRQGKAGQSAYYLYKS